MFKPGQRVVVNGEHGTVTSTVPSAIPLAPQRATVKLDTGRTVECAQGALSPETLSTQDVKNAIEEIEKLLGQIPKLPAREKGELPNHLKYLKEDVQVPEEFNKQLATANLSYITTTLKAVSETESSETWWQKVEPSLNKIRNWLAG
ncbi:hypothetical protein NUACC21_40460 [Scytonema sp. NUACC21]